MIFIRRILPPLLSVFIFASATSLWAAFDQTYWGTRAAGMGGAFVARADDASAPFWNPGASSRLKRGEASFLWDRAYPGLADVNIASGFISVVKPYAFGAWGLGVTAYQVGDLLRENEAFLHLSQKVGQRFSAGVNVKYLIHDYGVANDPLASSNPIFANGTSQDAFTLDAGLLYSASDSLSYGLAARNVTQPDLGLVLEDRLPAEFQGGANWKTGLGYFELDGLYKNNKNASGVDNTDLLIGMERWIHTSPASLWASGVRFGARRNLGAIQKNFFREVSTGASLLVGPEKAVSFRIDYAFILNLNLLGEDTGALESSSHQVGFSVLFGR